MADNRVELPDGAWADLRNPREITRKERRPIQAANARLNRYRDELRQLSGAKWNPSLDDEPTDEEKADWVMSEEEVDLYDAINVPLTVAMVEAWSFDATISADGLDSIPALAADDLIVHIATGGYMTQMFVNTTDPDIADADSPT